jgi:radical SAM superfamily enzyme YgiQ (UPF0313 family)
MKKTIYFADLTYNTIVVSSDLVPLGCGYVAAYAHSLYAQACDMDIFKYPEELLSAIDVKAPDVFASSCYVWNKNLSLLACKIIKENHPQCVTVLGGPAFPLDAKRQKEFLRKNPQVDFFIPFDGELGFAAFLKEYLAIGAQQIKKRVIPVEGCVYMSSDNELITGNIIKRSKDLDTFPSPYLNGMLDKFLNGGEFSPMVQTTRGCPFTCSYCWASNEQNRCRIGFFSHTRVKEELAYIAPIAKKNNIFHLVICDSNFGLYEKDNQTIDYVYQLQQNINYPNIISAYFGRGNRAQLVKNLAKLKGVTYDFATQSTDSQILRNVNRENVDLEQLSDYVKEAHRLGNIAGSDIITGLPYETRQTHMQTIKDLLDCGFDYIDPFTFMLLDGTELDSEEAHARFAYDIRYRIIPRNFGTIQGIRSFEIERVVVGTNSYNYDDYIFFRSFHGLLRFLLNNNINRELLYYVKQSGVHLLDYFMFVFEDLKEKPSRAAELFNEYVDEARSELWDSSDALVQYYSQEENYNKLLSSERGDNLMQKFSALASSIYFNDYRKHFFKLAIEYLLKRYPAKKDQIQDELGDINSFTEAKLSDIFTVENIEKTKTFLARYDILRWVNEGFTKPLSDYRLKQAQEMTLELSDDQMKLIRDIFKRYNIHKNNLSGLYKATAQFFVYNYLRAPVADEEAHGV